MGRLGNGMSIDWQSWDVMAVAATVAFAAAWLGFRVRRHLRRSKGGGGKTGACGADCDGCPFARDCGGRPR